MGGGEVKREMLSYSQRRGNFPTLSVFLAVILVSDFVVVSAAFEDRNTVQYCVAFSRLFSLTRRTRQSVQVPESTPLSWG